MGRTLAEERPFGLSASDVGHLQIPAISTSADRARASTISLASSSAGLDSVRPLGPGRAHDGPVPSFPGEYPRSSEAFPGRVEQAASHTRP